MKRYLQSSFGVLLLFASAATFAQMGPSTPSPELKKLDYFSGTWTTDANIASGPWGSGGKFTVSGTAEWMKGEFFQVNHSDFSLPDELGGKGTSLAIFGYDSDKKVYTEDRFDSLGRHAVITGTLDGDTWTWDGENHYGGMTIKTRLTLKEISPASYTTKYEVSPDGGASWMPFWDGKATKK